MNLRPASELKRMLFLLLVLLSISYSLGGAFNSTLFKDLQPEIIRVRRDGGTVTAAIIGVLATVAGAGISTGVRNINLSYGRNMEMTITNYLKWSLVQPKSFARTGQISSPNPNIKSCFIESMSAHKTGHSSAGTSGIASWKVVETGTTIIVLWNVPYYSVNCNQLAVAIYHNLPDSEPNHRSEYDIFYDLFSFHKPAKDFLYAIHDYHKANYCHRSIEICAQDDHVKVCGTMNTVSVGKVKIDVTPIKKNDLVTQESCDSHLKHRKNSK